VLGKHRGVLIPESKNFHQAHEGPLFQPFHRKKIEIAMCSPMASSSGGFHGNTRIYIGCGMVQFHPNVVEGLCVGLVDCARVGNAKFVHHVDAGTI
jgi:hypothetical protein